jgi:hypothetical protein
VSGIKSTITATDLCLTASLHFHLSTIISPLLTRPPYLITSQAGSSSSNAFSTLVAGTDSDNRPVRVVLSLTLLCEAWLLCMGGEDFVLGEV